MGIASFSPTGLFGSFQGLVGWFNLHSAKTRSLRQALALRPGPARGNACASHASAAPMRGACPSLHPATPLRPLRPLRVLRVVDGPQTPANAGRMLISGRMADVCAELDRLAALESGPRALLQ
ncbi:hypothetical protein J2X19_002656 [Rhodoferax ferrireducens]|uniref:Uncharacterized protein n=1 Tax=Rhodoferax ferrireducens TaxID=192843 RepID=A0ABU2C9F7_9BURK|nr:hypothetical protein [Rhodoferax ferrireducens]MDR7377977.1 hypothetical protein [Rhodoferax ferrireducens]